MDFSDVLPFTYIGAGFLALAAAIFVYRFAPDRQVARRFGLLLALEALMIWTVPRGVPP